SGEDATAGETEGTDRRLTIALTPVPRLHNVEGVRGRGGDRSMAELSSPIVAVLSGVLVAALAFYVWGRRLERRAAESSQRVVLAAKEELMSVRENLHHSLDQKIAGVDRREQDLRKLEQQLEERARA